MTQRRQVGFIKSYNHIHTNFQEESSEFSYFRVKPKDDDDEFSPYKFQDDPTQMKNTVQVSKKPISRPPLPQRTVQKAMTVSNLADRAKADQLYQKIRQNIASYEQKRSVGRQSLQENIGNIRNKIQKLDQVLNQLKTKKEPERERRATSFSKKKIKFQEDSSSSSNSQDEVRVKAIPPPKADKPYLQETSKRAYHDQQSESQEEESQEIVKQTQDDRRQHSNRLSDTNRQTIPEQQNVITFNSRLKNQPPIQIQQYSSSSSDLSESQQPSQQHVQHLPERHSPGIKGKSEKQMYKNKGGVCFDVDVKQFKGPVQPQKNERPAPVQKKKPKVDKKVELLRRREAAKAYDRMARRAVFSPQY